ncbi:type II secretion system protein GspG [Candidatus Dependentiae bacterium]|nr:type II secretion system protein GspG [Candidatus Dependentiae bacterium]
MKVFSRTLRPGYSYIELMVAVLVIVLLMSFVGPKVFKLLGSAKKASTQNTLKIIKNAIQEYKMQVGTYPTTLKALIEKPEGVVGWEGPYVGDENSAQPEVPKDAWNQDFTYKLNERGAKPPFELYSLGDPEKEEDRIDA